MSATQLITDSESDFIAEDSAAVDSHLTTYNAEAALTGMDDRAILSVVKTIQSLISKLTDLATQVASFAERFTTKELGFQRAIGESLTLTRELCINKSDGTPLCVTGDQLGALLSHPANDNPLTPQPVEPAMNSIPTTSPDTTNEPPSPEAPADVQPPVPAANDSLPFPAVKAI